MGRDYIVFIHGVNNRSRVESLKLTNALFLNICDRLPKEAQPIAIPIFWGDICMGPEASLRQSIISSPVWDSLWFKGFRSTSMIPFAGDAAMYLSRSIGLKVVERLKLGLDKVSPLSASDRLHIVGHSWGTVILFDILFAKRWTFANAPGFQLVQELRGSLFGLPPQEQIGIKISSLHTMGSPLALVSLLHLSESSHNFQPLMESFLEALCSSNKSCLPWMNYIHPGDPVAWPLENVLSCKGALELKDTLTTNNWKDKVYGLVKHTPASLVYGGTAHTSYWSNQMVAFSIANCLIKS